MRWRRADLLSVWTRAAAQRATDDPADGPAYDEARQIDDHERKLVDVLGFIGAFILELESRPVGHRAAQEMHRERSADDRENDGNEIAHETSGSGVFVSCFL